MTAVERGPTTHVCELADLPRNGCAALVAPLHAILVFAMSSREAAFVCYAAGLHTDCERKRLTPECADSQIEKQQDNNTCLSYWLSNTVTLLYLLQKNIKPASGGTYTSRLRSAGPVGGRRAH